MPGLTHAYHSMRLAKKATSIPIAGAKTEGTIENPALVGAGAGAWALAITATLDMTARITTAEFTMLLDAIVLIGVRSCNARAHSRSVTISTQGIVKRYQPHFP